MSIGSYLFNYTKSACYHTVMKRRVAVRAIIVQDGKLLCVRLRQYEGKATSDNDYWCTPGGGVDEGEALIPALKREIIEELGPEPEVGALLYIQQFIHGDTEQLEFFFHVTNAGDYADLDLSATTHGAAEIEVVDFVDAGTENVLPKFLRSETFADLDGMAAAKIFNYID
jgi:8-oxo-dGTP pyrophosphatase MutT (NUDIX family)